MNKKDKRRSSIHDITSVNPANGEIPGINLSTDLFMPSLLDGLIMHVAFMCVPHWDSLGWSFIRHLFCQALVESCQDNLSAYLWIGCHTVHDSST